MFEKLKKIIEKEHVVGGNDMLRLEMYKKIYEIRKQCQSPLQRIEINELIKMVENANNVQQFMFCAREISGWKEHNKGCPIVQGKHND